MRLAHTLTPRAHNRVRDRYLRSSAIQAPLTNLTSILPDATPKGGMFSVDTADLFSALEGETGKSKRSLTRTCQLLRVHLDEPKTPPLSPSTRRRGRPSCSSS